MKLNRTFIFFIFLLTVLTLGVASASNVNETQDLTVLNVDEELDEINNFEEVIAEDSNDDVAEQIDNGQLQQEDENSSDDDRFDIQFDLDDEYMKGWSLDFQFPEDATSKNLVKIYIDDELCKVKNSYANFYYIYLDKFSLGKHVLKIDFKGTEDYKPFNKTFNFKIVSALIYIPENFELGKNSVLVNLPYNVGGTITIYVDGKEYKKYTKDDFIVDIYYDEGVHVSDRLIGLSATQHTVKVTYRDSQQGTTSKQATVNFTYKMDLDISSPCIYGVDSEDSRIIISMISDVKGKPTVKIDGVKYKVTETDTKGEFYLDVSEVPIGNHVIKVSYREGSKYPLKTVTANFTVAPAIIAPSNYIYRESKISLKLPADAKGKLEVYISKKKGVIGDLYKSSKFKNGVASISLDDLKTGTYYAHIIYTGDDYEVKDVDCKINMLLNVICPEEMSYGQNKYLIVKSYKTDNRKLNVNLLGESFKTTVKLVNGVGKVSIKKLPIGDLDGIVTNSQKDILGSFIITVNPMVGKNVVMHYTGGNKYSVKVYNDNGKIAGKGKTVKIKIDGKTYKVKTNKKGIASLKITAKPGEYQITAHYRGFKISNTVVVKHILKLDSLKVNKSAKKLVLKATLKKGKTPLKSKKVTFKFNGKKYVAKTNKKGIVKVTVKRADFKDLEMGKKIIYSATYAKDTVKKSSLVLI